MKVHYLLVILPIQSKNIMVKDEGEDLSSAIMKAMKSPRLS